MEDEESLADLPTKDKIEKIDQFIRTLFPEEEIVGGWFLHVVVIRPGDEMAEPAMIHYSPLGQPVYASIGLIESVKAYLLH